MENHVDRFRTCCSSANMRARHDALIDLIGTLVPLLNVEIGPIGGAAIREILDVQKRYKPMVEQALVPFAHEYDDHNTYLTIELGRVRATNGTSYAIGIHAETPWHNRWYFQGYGGENEGVADEVRELGRDEVAVAARRLAIALAVLDEVFPDPEWTIHAIVVALREAELLPDGKPCCQEA